MKLTLGLFMLAATAPANAAIQNTSGLASADAEMRFQLASRYPGSRVELTGAPRWVRGGEPVEGGAIQFVEETPRGEAVFWVGNSQAVVPFAAWTTAWIALRRITPGEKLSPELFTTQEINVSSGQAREYRGALLPIATELHKLESRFTILAGQYALSTSVQKIPDVRRGDPVSLVLRSAGVSVRMRGTAAEAAHIGGTLRAVTTKTKRELTGKLTSDGAVEVDL